VAPLLLLSLLLLLQQWHWIRQEALLPCAGLLHVAAVLEAVCIAEPVQRPSRICRTLLLLLVLLQHMLCLLLGVSQV
jgi:hypothetical protein